MGAGNDDASLGPYRRLRKRVPPPGGPHRDRRGRIRDEQAREEIEGVTEGGGPLEEPWSLGETVVFEDRKQAGRELAEALAFLEGEDVVVLGIPRGGVEVAAEVSRRWGWPLDVVIPRKVRAPANPELGIGAVAPGVRVLDERMIRMLRVPQDYLQREIALQEDEIRRRTEAYRGGREAIDLAGKAAIVVDDGVATGGTAIASLRWARAQRASWVVLAVPVAPPEVVGSLAEEADRVVVLSTPRPFQAVGQWYRSFPQVPDEEVTRLLEETQR